MVGISTFAPLVSCGMVLYWLVGLPLCLSSGTELDFIAGQDGASSDGGKVFRGKLGR